MSEQQLDCIDKLILCFQQKNLFITNILNITKQLEIKTENEEVDFEDLLEKRGEFMSRIDKCTALEKATISSLDEDEKDAIKNILSFKECNHENGRLECLSSLVLTYDNTLRTLVVADKVAVDKLKARHALARDKVNSLRQARQHDGNLYNM